AFFSTLRGDALDWFHQLAPRSIKDFEDFAGQLTIQYLSVVAQEKTYLTLMAMQKVEKDSLRKYVARYNQMCLEVPTAVDEVKAGGLIRILRPGPCRTSLAKTPARTYDEVLRRCKKYINLEETEAEFAKLEEVAKLDQRKKKPNSPRRGSPRRNPPKNGSSKRASPRREGRFHGGREDRWQGRPRLPNGQRYNNFTPINAQMGEVLAAIKEKLESKEVTWPATRFEGPTKPRSGRYCRFHRDYGHNTEDCIHLKDEIERLIRAEHLKEFVIRDRPREKDKRRCREDSVVR
ncbi:Unknown protein, partial [Striga hermonthica]